MEKALLSEITELTANEHTLKAQLDSHIRERLEMTSTLTEEKALRKKLQDEITKIQKNQEEEVQLRLQFESKLNGLHSLHRDLEATYERAK